LLGFCTLLNPSFCEKARVHPVEGMEVLNAVPI
jgi:hypothetical protein